MPCHTLTSVLSTEGSVHVLHRLVTRQRYPYVMEAANVSPSFCRYRRIATSLSARFIVRNIPPEDVSCSHATSLCLDLAVINHSLPCSFNTFTHHVPSSTSPHFRTQSPIRTGWRRPRLGLHHRSFDHHGLSGRRSSHSLEKRSTSRKEVLGRQTWGALEGVQLLS